MWNLNFDVIFFIFFLLLLIIIYIKTNFSKEKIWKKSYWLRESIFTQTELFFYNSLNAFFYKNNLNQEKLIFTKIRMIDIFYPSKYFNWVDNKQYLNKILAKHIDFIITDKKWKPLILIELDDIYHKWNKYYKSDQLKNDITKYTWIPLIRYKASNYYNFSEILCLL
jgi:hypothetical protein